MTKEKPTPKKKEDAVHDLEPAKDPKGGQAAAADDTLKTTVRVGTARGGWDGNHNLAIG